jgi:hypothetical protein
MPKFPEKKQMNNPRQGIIPIEIKVPEGDSCNWQEINNWAEKLLPKLTGIRKD